MGKGINAYSRKQRREARRRNHIAKDLADRKYHQRIKQSDYKTRKEELRYEDDDN